MSGQLAATAVVLVALIVVVLAAAVGLLALTGELARLGQALEVLH